MPKCLNFKSFGCFSLEASDKEYVFGGAQSGRSTNNAVARKRFDF